MISVKYKVEFFNEWHAGSGLSAGADVDDLVIKDRNNLPFIPGKTVKGLIRHAIEEIVEYRGDDLIKKEAITNTFGVLTERPVDKSNENSDTEVIESRKGSVFFSNAILSNELSNNILENDLSQFLYRSVASTAIDEKGIAKDHSLRKMQTTVPCVLYGDILYVDKELEKEIVDALSYIKRLGVNRNRGLGRCKFSVVAIKKEEDV